MDKLKRTQSKKQANISNNNQITTTIEKPESGAALISGFRGLRQANLCLVDMQASGRPGLHSEKWGRERKKRRKKRRKEEKGEELLNSEVGQLKCCRFTVRFYIYIYDYIYVYI